MATSVAPPAIQIVLFEDAQEMHSSPSPSLLQLVIILLVILLAQR